MSKIEALQTIALLQCSGIGAKTANALIRYFGSTQNIYTATKTELQECELLKANSIADILKKVGFKEAEFELNYCENNQVEVLLQTDKNYPENLKIIADAPPLLFAKGAINFNQQKIISVVGTRRMTNYGKNCTELLIEDLAPYNPIIISGLAFGIDAAAHTFSVEHNLQTIGVLANGINKVTPEQHLPLAKKMLENGGLLTELTTQSKALRQQFPRRNRIVAGIADAVVVVETGTQGGSMITANLALSYNKEVAAFPGSVFSKWSEGTNNLIQTNRAYPIHNGQDLAQLLGWTQKQAPQFQIEFEQELNLPAKQQLIFQYLKTNGSSHIDAIQQQTQLQSSELSMLLLELEFASIVQAKPGKFYELR